VQRGGVGKDRLSGGAGNDVLYGNSGSDVFVFSRADGRDVIADFSNGTNTVRIEGGAERFRDLRVTEFGDDVAVAFARTEIVLRGIEAADLGVGDFLFI